MIPDFKITDFKDYESIENQYTKDFIKSSRCVKVSEERNYVTVACAVSSENKKGFLNEIHYPKKVKVISIKDSDFSEFIGNCVENNFHQENAKQENAGRFKLEDINNSAPVVNIINAVCLEAVRKGVSDIHIQCEESFIKIRFRIDGVLQTVKKLDKSIFESLVSRIKIMSGLNIMESRLPQDGRMSVESDGKNYDFRVSIVPVAKGQSVVLRLFDAERKLIKLEDLGFSSNTLALLKKGLNLADGLVLLTGPTGSGKTTTLHAMIDELDKEHLKIITIEDPVERQLEDVDQIQVNESIGLTFENILRRVLRQDPDVIMIGEIRDKATAELAVRASLTGHLIFSTLHTNDSIGAVTRLINLGIEPYLVSSVLKISVAQRLVRKICPVCHNSTEHENCSFCNFTGYSGRTAVSEGFENDPEIADLIEKKSGEGELRKLLNSRKFINLKDDAQIKVKEGCTDSAEIKREALA